MKVKNIFFLLSLFSAVGVSAQFGNALHFDGSNDYVTAPVPSIFSNVASQNFTVEFKIKPETFSTNRVFYLQTSTSNFATVMLNNQGKIYFYIPSQSAMSSNSLVLNSWNHVSVVKNGSVLEIYMNGVLETTSNGGSTSTSGVNMLGIGAKPDGTQLFKGIIDEFRIWNTARSAADITANMNSEITLPQTDLVTYYKFNQGVANGSNPTITSLTDEFALANGTLTNFTLSGSTSNWVGSLQLAIDEVMGEKYKFGITPNPTTEIITVKGLNKKSHYTLLNSVGQKIESGYITKDQNSINVMTLKSGLYLLEVEGQVLKFIKQ